MLTTVRGVMRKLPYWPILLVILGLILLASGYIAYWLILTAWGVLKLGTSHKPWEYTLQYVIQYIVQFFFVAVLGGIVGFYFHAIETRRAEELRERDKAQDSRKSRLDALEMFRKDLVNIYYDLQKVRRTLRASSFPTTDGRGYCCERGTFEHLMGQMVDVQLRIASLKDGVKAHEDLFNNKKHEILGSLDEAVKYLGKLLADYEDGYSDRRNLKENDLIQLSNLLIDFVRQTAEESGLHEPIFNARKNIVGLIEQHIRPKHMLPKEELR